MNILTTRYLKTPLLMKYWYIGRVDEAFNFEIKRSNWIEECNSLYLTVTSNVIPWYILVNQLLKEYEVKVKGQIIVDIGIY